MICSYHPWVWCLRPDLRVFLVLCECGPVLALVRPVPFTATRGLLLFGFHEIQHHGELFVGQLKLNNRIRKIFLWLLFYIADVFVLKHMPDQMSRSGSWIRKRKPLSICMGKLFSILRWFFDSKLVFDIFMTLLFLKCIATEIFLKMKLQSFLVQDLRCQFWSCQI